VTSPGKVKICFDGNYMLQRCEKEQCAQNFSGSLKNELTAERMVPKRRLESRLLGIMKATNMQELETAKLATNERDHGHRTLSQISAFLGTRS
jgi:hypothetical protein